MVTMLPIVAALMSEGLSILGNAVLSKGKEVVEDRLGIKLPDGDHPLDAAQVVDLKRAEMAHEEWLIDAGIRKAQQEIEADKLAYQDTASARDMNTRINESANSAWLSKNIAAILAIFVIVVGFALLGTTTQPDVRTAVVGLMTLVLGFYFGSTTSSRHKDDTIAALSKGGQQ